MKLFKSLVFCDQRLYSSSRQSVRVPLLFNCRLYLRSNSSSLAESDNAVSRSSLSFCTLSINSFYLRISSSNLFCIASALSFASFALVFNGITSSILACYFKMFIVQSYRAPRAEDLLLIFSNVMSSF